LYLKAGEVEVAVLASHHEDDVVVVEEEFQVELA
jgi:hypothetical protein